MKKIFHPLQKNEASYNFPSPETITGDMKTILLLVSEKFYKK